MKFYFSENRSALLFKNFALRSALHGVSTQPIHSSHTTPLVGSVPKGGLSKRVIAYEKDPFL